jgi:hypothetical protein
MRPTRRKTATRGWFSMGPESCSTIVTPPCACWGRAPLGQWSSAATPNAIVWSPSKSSLTTPVSNRTPRPRGTNSSRFRGTLCAPFSWANSSYSTAAAVTFVWCSRPMDARCMTRPCGQARIGATKRYTAAADCPSTSPSTWRSKCLRYWHTCKRINACTTTSSPKTFCGWTPIASHGGISM